MAGPDSLAALNQAERLLWVTAERIWVATLVRPHAWSDPAALQAACDHLHLTAAAHQIRDVAFQPRFLRSHRLELLLVGQQV